jgi:excisionase family DNA binding protein
MLATDAAVSMAALSAEVAFLEVAEVAELLRRKPQTITRWCRQGRLTGAIQPVRHWLIPASTVTALVQPRQAQVA